MCFMCTGRVWMRVVLKGVLPFSGGRAGSTNNAPDLKTLASIILHASYLQCPKVIYESVYPIVVRPVNFIPFMVFVPVTDPVGTRHVGSKCCQSVPNFSRTRPWTYSSTIMESLLLAVDGLEASTIHFCSDLVSRQQALP